MYTSLERNGTSGHPIDILQGTVLISLAPVLYCGQKSVEQHKKNVYQSTIEVYFQYINDIFNKHGISTDTVFIRNNETIHPSEQMFYANDVLINHYRVYLRILLDSPIIF